MVRIKVGVGVWVNVRRAYIQFGVLLYKGLVVCTALSTWHARDSVTAAARGHRQSGVGYLDLTRRPIYRVHVLCLTYKAQGLRCSEYRSSILCHGLLFS